MAFSSGTYTLPGAALNTGDTVSATENNTFRNDVATAFNLTWLRDGSAAATANIPMGGFSFTNCAAVGSNGSLLLKVNNGTTAATLDTSGNLGLGVTPSYRLDVSSSNTSSVRITGAGTSPPSLYSYSDSGGVGWMNATPYSNGALYYQTGKAHNWFVGSSQAMTLDASGNLGVGLTTIPSNQGNSIAVGNTSGANINITSNSAAGTSGSPKYLDLRFLGYSNNEMARIRSWDESASTGNGNLTFWTGVGGSISERARIDSSGNLLVGTTNTSSTAGNGLKVTSGSGAADSVSVVTGATTNAGLTTYQLYSTGAGAYRFYVGGGGTVFATITTISAISDIRFKENVRDLDAGLAEVMALKPRLYDWKEGKGADIKNARGFIAQEFEQVFPDLIDEWRDPAPEGEEPYKSVRQDLMPVLVKAIQEQQAIITQLQADVAALKG